MFPPRNSESDRTASVAAHAAVSAATSGDGAYRNGGHISARRAPSKLSYVPVCDEAAIGDGLEARRPGGVCSRKAERLEQWAASQTSW